jgi:hypothetical protein
VAKAILLLDPDGLALTPATLCAEAAVEAQELNLPLFEEALAQLSAGKELRMNGGTVYELFQAGEHVATIETLDAPTSDRQSPEQAEAEAAANFRALGGCIAP